MITLTYGLGIILAFIAMIFWGFGDFLIQKSTRKVGDWETLFIISLFGCIVLAPFVWHSFPLLVSTWSMPLAILIIASFVLFLAALLEFESLKEGKISVVEPSWTLEIPIAALFAFIFLNEHISSAKVFIIVFLMISLILLGIRTSRLSKSLLLEKGTLLALLAGVVMGGANFLTGWSGRVTDPLLVNFFISAFLMIASGIYLLYKGKLQKTFLDVRHSYGLLLPMALFDNIAWVAFIFSASLVPIAISTALSESYIIIAVLLGIFINREKLYVHQKIGLACAIVFALLLSFTT